MKIPRRFRYSKASIFKLNKIQEKTKNQVEEKLIKGVYQLEQINCPICNNKSSNIIAERDRYGLNYKVKICVGCGLIYTNPRMTQLSYNEFYDTEYRKLYLGTEIPKINYLQKQYERGGEIYNWIDNLNLLDLSKVRVLEVGCSSGGIIAYFAKKGCDVIGVDLDSSYLHFGIEQFNLNLIHGSLEDIPSDFSPDLIIYSHVLEHILDLNKELKRIREISSSNTLIYIEVPGVKNIHNAYSKDLLHYLQNAHTFHFTLTSLENLLKRHSYSLLKGDEYIRSIFKMKLKDEQILYKNDFQEVLDYLRKIEQERIKGKLKIGYVTRRTVKNVNIFLIKLLTFLKIKDIVKGLFFRKQKF